MMNAKTLSDDSLLACEHENYMIFKRDSFNSSKGVMTELDCSVCNNKGFVMFLRKENGQTYECLRKCNCSVMRDNASVVERSGLKGIIQNYTFDAFLTPSEWQENVKNLALRYLADNNGKWFYIGGQVGSGKSHLCTAIVGEMMQNGLEAKYLMWRDETITLRADIMSPAYRDTIHKLKTVRVLYIDDFFKTEHKKTPSAAEINIAFEILNFRYNNSECITIISSEKHIYEINKIDKAVGSRIIQRSKEYCINIEPDSSKNYRLL